MTLVADRGRPSSPTEPSTRSNPCRVLRHRPAGTRTGGGARISTFEVNFGNINQRYYFSVPKVMVNKLGRGPRRSKVLSSACERRHLLFGRQHSARPPVAATVPAIQQTSTNIQSRNSFDGERRHPLRDAVEVRAGTEWGFQQDWRAALLWPAAVPRIWSASDSAGAPVASTPGLMA
jgi:hypothetical protein